MYGYWVSQLRTNLQKTSVTKTTFICPIRPLHGARRGTIVNNDDKEEGALPLRHLCTKRHILKIIL